MDSDMNSGTSERASDPDLELVRRFKSGVEGAFDGLYQRHSTYIYNTCLGILGDPDDARDALQDTFVQAYRSLPKFRGDSKFTTWLYRIAVSKCMDLARRRPKWESAEALDWIGDGEDRQDDGMLEERVRDAILRLRPEFRAVLVLCHFRELSYAEIAASLGWSVDKVRVWLHRARKAFRATYAEGDGGHEV